MGYTQNVCLKDVANHLQVFLKHEGNSNQLLDKRTRTHWPVAGDLWLQKSVEKEVRKTVIKAMIIRVLGFITLSRRDEITTETGSDLSHYD